MQITHKFLRLLAFTPLFCASVANASETRMSALAGATGIEDESNVYIYPASVVKYDAAVVELGTTANSNVYGGVLTSPGKSGYGLIVSRDESLLTTEWVGTPSLADAYLTAMSSNENGLLPTPERPIDLLFGMSLGGNSAFGLGVTLASYVSKSDNGGGATNVVKKEADQLDLHLGYSNFGSKRLDIGLDIGVLGALKSSADNGTIQTEYSFKRSTYIQLNGRYFLNSKGAAKFVSTNLALRSADVKADNGTVSEEGEFDETFLNIEGGAILKPAKKTLFTGSVGLLYGSSKGPTVTGTADTAVPSLIGTDEEAERETQWIYSRLGLEAPVSESFGVLGGLRYMLFGSTELTDKTAAGEPKTEVSVAETEDKDLWSLGMFYEQGKLRVDVLGTKTFLHNGPFFVSGGNTGTLFAMISLLYQI